jgi:hypothetical protein
MKKIFIAIIFLTASFIAIGQGVGSGNSNPFKAPTVIPPTPEAVSLGKYVDIPVGYSTGTPIINIPIYTIKEGNIEVPISLSYNSSGIKVEEAATWVGLGWNLSPGGSINRVMKGMPDEDGFMINAIPTVRSIMSNIASTTYMAAQTEIPAEFYDVQPDVFSFNILGYSGKFYWLQDLQKFVLAPLQNIDISYDIVNNKLARFIMTLPNGTKCYFGVSSDLARTAYETTNDQQITSVISNLITPSQNTNRYAHISGWAIMDIVTAEGKKVSFDYGTYETKNFGRAGENANLRGLDACDVADGARNANFFTQRIYKYFPTRIYTAKETVKFFQAASIREDVFINEKALSKVEIYANDSTRIKQYRFHYSYTPSPDTTHLPDLDAYEQTARKRMFLDSIQETTGSDSLPPYIFTYNSTPLPNRFSESQDYWGYYNGKTSIGHLLTPRIRSKYLSDGSYVNASSTNYAPSFESFYITSHTGLDRRVDTSLNQAGILTRVKYPTGGETVYEYEPNRASMQYYDKYSGIELSGLRQRKIIFPGVIDANIPRPILHYEQQFTVNDLYGAVEMKVHLPGCIYGTPSQCGIKMKIRRMPASGFNLLEYTMSTNENIILPDGTYIITVDIDPTYTTSPVPQLLLEDITLEWQEVNDYKNFIVGGVRIKKIVSYDNIRGSISRSFNYNRIDSPGTSSGYVIDLPKMLRRVRCRLYECVTNGSGTICQYAYQGYAYKLTSNSQLTSSFDGTSTRYSNVSEYLDSNQSSIKKQYSFFNPYNSYLPKPATSITSAETAIIPDWQIGLPSANSSYEKKNQQHRPLQSEETTYDYYGVIGNIKDMHFLSYKDPADVYLGINYEIPLVGYREFSQSNGLTPIMPPPNGTQAELALHYFRSEWYLPKSSTSKLYSYDLAGNPRLLTTVATNDYNGDHLLSKTTTTNSKGKTIQNKMYYTNDYDNSIPNISALKSKHIIQLPIKQETIINNNLKAGSIISYNSNGQPIDIYSYENSSSVPPVLHNSSILVQGDYKPKYHLEYNSNGDVISQNKANDIKESYIYGYNNQYPVAKVVGSNYNTVWGSLTQAQKGFLNNATGSELNNDDVSVRQVLQTLRTSLPNALVTTYTYKPLVGVTSETDPQGKTIYYVYDNFNRLKLIKDKDNNILKTFEYKYQEQQ